MFAVGHSTHALEELLALLRRHGVVTLADVRRYPGSKRMPWFSSEPGEPPRLTYPPQQLQLG